MTLQALLKRCEVDLIGIDGGVLDDMLGVAVIGREAEATEIQVPEQNDPDTGELVPAHTVFRKRWLHWGHAWVHEIALERRKEIAPRLLDFQKERDLTIVQRPGLDVSQVVGIVCKVQEAGLLPEKMGIGVDGAGITDIVDALVAKDFNEDHIIAIQQGWKLNGAVKTTERKVAGGELVHGGRPLMAWCVGNARTVDNGNAISITKQASGKAKIDPVMALFDAVSLMALNPVASGRSFWETA